MSFTNPEIQISDLPSFEDISYNYLAPAYARVNATVVFVIDTLLMLGLLAAARLKFPDLPTVLQAVAICLALVLVALSTVFSWYAARAKRYAVRKHDLAFESGLFWKSQTIQPLRRVQHVEVARGPIDKRFGIAHVRLFSAGSGAASFTIPGLLLADAEQLREFVLSYKDSA